MNKVKLTMLNFMADWDFVKALDIHKSWGIDCLDLKDGIFGKPLIDLTKEEALRAKAEIDARGMSVYCFSSVLFYDDIELGEQAFLKRNLEPLEKLLQVAEILSPKLIRLLAAKSRRRNDFLNIMDYVIGDYPWLIPVYRMAVEQIHKAGFHATIENEAEHCIFSTPEEVLQFYKELNAGEMASFTYDIQNLWQMGTYPTVESFEKLKGITDFFHLKGGKENQEKKLDYASSLEDATWPVLEITKRAIDSCVSPVICLNPSHGKSEGYDYSVKRDIDFLRKNFTEVE